MKAEDFTWYHPIDLKDGTVTKPANDYSHCWNIIREVRDKIDYHGKTVLDIASWDGLWAFEAEELGAAAVVATDVIAKIYARRDIGDALDKFLFAREKRGSRVIPYYDRSIHTLRSLIPLVGRFEILQNLGLLYHLENPWHALKQCRHIMQDNALMLLETAYDSKATGASMRMNRGSSHFYNDDTTYWAPSRECLIEMLKACCFQVDEESIRTAQDNVGRICLTARALPYRQCNYTEFNNDFRTAL